MITFQTDLNSARVLAAVEKKHVLAIWCAPGCIACGQTLTLWNHPTVQPYLEQNFVLYRGPQIGIPPSFNETWIPYAKGIKLLSCPFVVLTGSTQPIGEYFARWGGYVAKANLMATLQGMLIKHPLPA